MSFQIPHILGSDSITVFVDGNSFTINRQAPTFEAVFRSIQLGDEQALRNCLDVKKNVVNQLQKVSNKVSIENGEIRFDGISVQGLISTRIFEMLRLGVDVGPMVKFLENLMQNPSKRAVDELFGFMEACSLPITPDGHFLAYKRVRADYKDCHSGTMDNSVGQVVQMPRNQVDDDKNRTCSAGLHFCSYSYLAHFGGERIVVLKINPADVVSIPTDYNNAKGRTCKYEVVGEIPLNEYKMPEYELQDSFTTDYYDDSEDYEDSDLLDDETWDEILGILDGANGTKAVDFDTASLVESKSVSAKLSAQDVVQIRKSLSEGQTLASLSREFGVSPRQIARIRDGQAWSSI